MFHDVYEFRITVRLTSAQYLYLCEYADRCGLTVGNVVRNLIESYILQNENK